MELTNAESLRAASRRAWLSAGAPIIGLVVLVILLALVLLINFAGQQDRAFRQSSQQLVASAIDARQHAISELTTDYAIWDAAYAALGARTDAGWLEDNYYSSVSDAMVVFRLDERPRYVWTSDDAGAEAEDVQRLVRASVIHIPGLRTFVQAEHVEQAAGVTATTIDGRLALIAAAPIAHEDDALRRAQSPDSVTYLAMMQFLDEADIAAMGRELGLEQFHFQHADAALGDGVVSMPVRAAKGEIVGRMVWRDMRPGAHTLSDQLWMVITGLVLAGAATLLIVRALVQRQVAAAVNAEAASESSRLKGEFISTMSNELRTPLNAIIGYAELLQEERWSVGVSDAGAYDDVSRILTAAHHLNRLVTDILDQSRLDAGRLPLKPEAIDATMLMTEVVEITESLAEARGNKIVMRAQPNLPRVMADHVRLRQCLLNLVGNAIKFTDRGTIILMARADTIDGRAMVFVDVADTGIGIARSQMESLFLPFTQADPVQEGAGLGLSISRKLARAMGGDITVASELGQGATFTLSAPAARTLELREVA